MGGGLRSMKTMVLRFPTRPRPEPPQAGAGRAALAELLAQLHAAGASGQPPALRRASGALGCSSEREALVLALQQLLQPSAPEAPPQDTYIPY